MYKKFVKNILTTSILLCSVNLYAFNETEIFRHPTQGKTTLLMMLESSSSMDDDGEHPTRSIADDYPSTCPNIIYGAPQINLERLSKKILDKYYNKQTLIEKNPAQAISPFVERSTFAQKFPYCNLIDSSKIINKDDSLKDSDPSKEKTEEEKNKEETLKNQIIYGTGYSRMDRMKISMSRLLGAKEGDADYVSQDFYVGLGQFSTHSGSEYATDWGGIIDQIKADPNSKPDVIDPTNYPTFYPNYHDFYSREAKFNHFGHIAGNDLSAKIVLPAQPLTNEQRYKMRVGVTAMESGGATPLASAVAEAGAYMLGTTTQDADGNSPVPKNSDWADILKKFYITDQNYTKILTDADNNQIKDEYGNPKRDNAEGPYRYSGIQESNKDATNKLSGKDLRYKTEIVADQCNANGIFLVTNGVPSETPRDVAEKMMQNALQDTSFTCDDGSDHEGNIKAVSKNKLLRFDENQNPPNKEVTNADFGWTCMAKFAKRLKEKNINLAVAGFGKNFIPYVNNYTDRSKEQFDCENIKSVDTTGKRHFYHYHPYNKTDKDMEDKFLKDNPDKKITDIPDSNYINKKQTIFIEENELQDIKNACYLGSKGQGFGEGGLYPIVSESDLSFAAQKFLAELNRNTSTMGAAMPATPIDPLNTNDNLNAVYYAMIKPDAQRNGVWLGNIKKYIVSNNIYQDQDSKAITDTNNIILTTRDGWNTSGHADGGNLLIGGSLSQQPIKKRKIYLSQENGLKLLSIDELKAHDNETNRYLMNLLGYNVNTNGELNLDTAGDIRQQGATLHSTPVFFTTKADLSETDEEKKLGKYKSREDYLLFGTAQGLIHILNASTGIEELAFLPQSMVDDQKNAFLAKNAQTGQPNYQGMDAPWTVYSTYSANDTNQSIRASKLYTFGGMRRGGGSYYGLDLSDNTDGIKPKLLFQINSFPRMAGSWSKPTIGKIKWKGKEQLVMIVGGGYDSVYDDPNYPTQEDIQKNEGDTTRGNGIYIFAAENNDDTKAGTLLWWASSSATTETGGKKVDELKYSVVSEIKAVDRNSDGLIDHLYFGDLGGQIFRVDINNKLSDNSGKHNIEVSNVVRIAHFQEEGKKSPRFYNKPTFTVSDVDSAGKYAVISIGSGDVSSPVRTLGITQAVTDKVYGIFDKDIINPTVFNLKLVDDSKQSEDEEEIAKKKEKLFKTLNLTLSQLTRIPSKLNDTEFAKQVVKNTNFGWYDELNPQSTNQTETIATQNKVLNNYSAVSNTLYTTYFDARDAGSIKTKCDAGIQGKTYAKTYCLPYGANCIKNGGIYTETVVSIGYGMQPLVIARSRQTDNTSAIGPVDSKPNSLTRYTVKPSIESIGWYTE